MHRSYTQMFSETAQVIKITHQTLWLQAVTTSGCGSCQFRRGCGTQALAQAFAKPAQIIRIKYDPRQFPDIQVGSMVLIGVQEKMMVTSALYVYILPIIGFLCLAGLAESLLANGILTFSGLLAVVFSACCGLAGGFFGYLIARHLLGETSQCSSNSRHNTDPDLEEVELLEVQTQSASQENGSDKA